MRKASREMDATFALEVLDKAPYVTVSKLTEGLTLCEHNRCFVRTNNLNDSYQYAP
jgi:hypothetical protein